jgi:hypothetical protein
VGRLGRLFFFVVLVAVAAPASGASGPSASCSGSVRAHRRSSCTRSIVVPHFNTKDAIDYSSLIARIDSPHATNWNVRGTLADARGVVYFAWSCSATRSSVTMGNESYVDHSCSAWRKMVRVRRNRRTYWQYYVADTSRPQRLHVRADVGNCIPTAIRGCRFEAKAAYALAG